MPLSSCPDASLAINPYGSGRDGAFAAMSPLSPVCFSNSGSLHTNRPLLFPPYVVFAFLCFLRLLASSALFSPRFTSSPSLFFIHPRQHPGEPGKTLLLKGPPHFFFLALLCAIRSRPIFPLCKETAFFFPPISFPSSTPAPI